MKRKAKFYKKARKGIWRVKREKGKGEILNNIKYKKEKKNNYMETKKKD